MKSSTDRFNSSAKLQSSPNFSSPNNATIDKADFSDAAVHWWETAVLREFNDGGGAENFPMSCRSFKKIVGAK